MAKSPPKNSLKPSYENNVLPYLSKLAGWRNKGLTLDDIAKKLGIHRATFYKWKAEHVDLNDALKTGTRELVAEIRDSLYKKAKGFEYEEESWEETLDRYGNVHLLHKRYKKYSVPDTGAAAFALKNLDREQFDNIAQRTIGLKEKEINLKEKEVEAIAAGVTINIAPVLSDFSKDDDDADKH